MTTRERTADIKKTLDTIAAKVSTRTDRYGDIISTITLTDTGEITRAWERLHRAGYWPTIINQATITV